MLRVLTVCKSTSVSLEGRSWPRLAVAWNSSSVMAMATDSAALQANGWSLYPTLLEPGSDLASLQCDHAKRHGPIKRDMLASYPSISPFHYPGALSHSVSNSFIVNMPLELPDPDSTKNKRPRKGRFFCFRPFPLLLADAAYYAPRRESGWCTGSEKIQGCSAC